MNILLITDSYPPEIRSASHLMQELAEGLAERGHSVTVATCYPRYNLAEDSKGIKFPEYAIENKIKVLRIDTLPHHKVNFIVRGIAQLTLPYVFLRKIKYYVKDVDAVIIYSPPLPLAVIGEKIKKVYGARFILNVQDIFPQNAIDLGVLKNRFLIIFFEKMESKVYKNADFILVHSESNAEFIKSRFHEHKRKISVLHNWIDTKEFEGIKRTNRFRKIYGLEDRFIILFAGVMGPSQGLDFVLDVAERVKDITDICFLLVGDGMEKDRLIRIAKEKGLQNVVFKPFVPKKDYVELVKDCDVGLVSLTNKNKTPVVPGKILGYMAAGIPVVAFLNRESDGHRIIRDANCGYSTAWGNLEEAVDIIKRIYNMRDRLDEFGRKGFEYVKNNFEKEICIQKLEFILKSS
ncbi:glycosyltransferase family 4 protein [Thermodesulfovibrio hydrogeniphilus]